VVGLLRRLRVTFRASPKPRSGLGDWGGGVSGDALLAEVFGVVCLYQYFMQGDFKARDIGLLVFHS